MPAIRNTLKVSITLGAVLGGMAPAAFGVSDAVLFTDKVWPVLKEKCLPCHGDRPDKIKGEYDMRTREGLLAGGESGDPAIVVGKPGQSPLYMAVTWADEALQMPPKENDRLSADQVTLLGEWIKRGAPYIAPEEARAVEWGDVTDDGEVVKTSGGLDRSWTYRRYAVDGLWAYRPIPKTLPPRATRHPVDAFVEQRLTQAGLRAAPRAGRRDLLRRVTFGLTGLPPTPEEMDAFLADDREDAFARVVDRLLASSAYGEKMAQHWLDVVRYADTSGYSNDFERPTAWRYRDYVIRSFNADKPYDRFVREQLAGDELRDAGDEGLIAAGFLRMGPWEHTSMSVAAETRQLFLDDVTHSVGVTFLGQQLRCCRCHDHKFDPIPTQDYYRFQALFAPVQFTDRSLPFLAAENTRHMAAGKERLKRRIANTAKRETFVQEQVERKVAVAEAVRGGAGFTAAERQKVFDQALKDQRASLAKATRKQKAYYEREAKRYEPYVYTVYNGPARVMKSNVAIWPMPGPEKRKGAAETVHILTGGRIDSPTKKVGPGVLSVVEGFAPADRPLGAGEIPQALSGRRKALAEWVVDPRNPLTARVMVNRVWQQLFGKGLVGTPNDFGKMGERPTHPGLLDYLAQWFMDNGWSVKKLQRHILLSDAYQRAAAPVDPQVRQRDGGNALLSYFPPRRLQAEELRDGMLAVTGELNREAGGPGVFPEINWEVAFQPRHIMGAIAPVYQPSPKRAERHRRVIYHFRYRGLTDPLLEVFNRPGSEMTCDRRDETIVTPQAFALFNSAFVHDRALALAALAEQEGRSFEERLTVIMQRLLGRAPEAEERTLLQRHFETSLAHHRKADPEPVPLPLRVERELVEELTGEPFTIVEELDNLRNYERDLKAWDVAAETRALAEVCLVLLNSNAFSFLY